MIWWILPGPGTGGPTRSSTLLPSSDGRGTPNGAPSATGHPSATAQAEGVLDCVTLMIPEAYRDIAMLTYPNDPWHTTTFTPCGGSAESYFAGGFDTSC